VGPEWARFGSAKKSRPKAGFQMLDVIGGRGWVRTSDPCCVKTAIILLSINYQLVTPSNPT
jgi:hypothetical protein